MDSDYLGTIDIAVVLGVTRQRVHQLISRTTFPKPIAVVNKRTPIWMKAQVVEWADANRYNIGDPHKITDS